MAKVLGEVTCHERERKVTIRTDKAAILLATGNRPGPVRVKLRRLNANQAQAYPPDGETEAWWGRLKNALGTSSDAFVDASLRRGLARHVLCAPRCYVRRIVNAVTALTKRLSCGLISKP
jgi:hypothetical protein